MTNNYKYFDTLRELAIEHGLRVSMGGSDAASFTKPMPDIRTITEFDGRRYYVNFADGTCELITLTRPSLRELFEDYARYNAEVIMELNFGDEE